MNNKNTGGRRRRILAIGAVVALSGIVLAGCRAQVTDSDQSDGVKAGPGVTADTITLGAIDALSGDFAANGSDMKAGRDYYFDQVNADGGICGREIVVDSRDGEYSPEKTVTYYTEMKSKVLAMVSVFGTGQTAALLDSLAADKMLAVPMSQSSTLLSPNIVIPGTIYEAEMTNMVSFLADKESLDEGDTIGVLYLANAFGESGLAGVQSAADSLGLTVVAQSAQVTDRDMTAQMTALNAAGVKAVFAIATAGQFASAVSVADSQGMVVPFGGYNGSVSADSLQTAAKDALEKYAYVASSLAPLSSAQSEEIVNGLEKANPGDAPGPQVNLGYVSGKILGAVLTQACENKDLTRQGLLDALQQLTSVDTGVGVNLDLSDLSKSPSAQSYIASVDASVVGGLRLIGDGAEASDLAIALVAGR